MDLQTLLKKNKAHREHVAAQQVQSVKEEPKIEEEVKIVEEPKEEILEELPEEIFVEPSEEHVVEVEEERVEEDHKDLFSFDAPAVSKKKSKKPAHREYMVMEDIDQANGDAE